MTSLTGRVALVTGASRGIGRAVAVRLASLGASVALGARTDAPNGRLAGTIVEVEEEITAMGGRAFAVACDVAEPQSCAAFVAAARSEFGPIDLLVNNAALTVPDPRPPGSARTGPRLSPAEALSIRNFPLTALRRAFEVNLFGAYTLTQLVVPDMIESGAGHIVNLSTDAAHTPGEGPYPDPRGTPLHAYSTSKAALEQLTRTVGYELAPHGIAVNAVLPSLPVATPGSEFAAGGSLGEVTLGMDRFVDAVERLCLVDPALVTGAVLYSEDVLEDGPRRGWLGDSYL